LSWNPVTNTGYYTIQFSRDITFTHLVAEETSTTPTFTPIADLPAGSTLYWRVRSDGAGGSSGWSTVRTIVTPNPPPVPTLLQPASNASMVEYLPAFAWNLGVMPRNTEFDHAQIQISKYPDFSTLVVNDSNSTSVPTGRFSQETDLSPNTQYYWRVRAFNTDGEMSSWSETRSFKTKALILDNRPGIYSIDSHLPAPVAASVDHVPASYARTIVDWTDVTTGSSYIIQVSTNSEFTEILVAATTIDSEYALLQDIPPGTTLYWRVLTMRSYSMSNWSSVYTLRVP
jgi:hypothetical protein